MTKKTRLIIGIVAILLISAISGCGSSKPNNSNDTNGDVSSAGTEQAEATLTEQLSEADTSAIESKSNVLANFFVEIGTDVKRSDIDSIAKEKGLFSSNKNSGTGVYTYRIAETKDIANVNKPEKGSVVTVSFNKLKGDAIEEITYFDAERMICGYWEPEAGYSMIDLRHPELTTDSITSKIPMQDANEIVNYTFSENEKANQLEVLYSSLFEGITKDELIALADENGLHYNSRGAGNEKVISYCLKVGDKYGETGSYITFSENSDGVISKVTYIYYPANYVEGLKACFYSEEYAASNSTPFGFALLSAEGNTEYSTAEEVLEQLHRQ